MLEALIGATVFTGVVMALVLAVLFARSRLAPSGSVALVVNGERRLAVPAGATLLEALSAARVPLPAGCGGRGTCGACRVVVRSGGGAVLPTETARIGRAGLARGERLACQVKLREDVAVELPPELLAVEEFECRVRSSSSVATYIKEIVLELPPERDFRFRAGAFVQVTAPPYRLRYDAIEVGEAYRAEWERLGLRALVASCAKPTTRAYSLANHPGERGVLVLGVRVALPPPSAPAGTPPGIVSSWLFGLRPGDSVRVSGPFGHFFAEDSEAEMVLVGGGAGMAPLRAHVLDQLEGRRSRRPIRFFYGARNRRELFYDELFERLAAEHANFRWCAALSEPRPEDHWKGPTGFVHEVLFERYLKEHPAPEACEYYLCGPPLMLRATLALLDELGVDPTRVHYDDFGS